MLLSTNFLNIFYPLIAGVCCTPLRRCMSSARPLLKVFKALLLSKHEILCLTLAT